MCLQFAHHVLYNFLTICYMPRIDSKLRGEPFWSCCCLHTIPLPLASHVLTISLLLATCPELTARCKGEPFWACCSLRTIRLPLASHVLSISLLFATCPELTASCDGEPFWGCCSLHTLSLPRASHVLTIPFATCPELTARWKKLDSFRVWCCVHTIPLPIAHHVFIISSLFATCPELTASCEGSRFGVAAVCIPFPYHFLPMSLQILYCVLHAQHSQQDARGNRFGLAAVCMSLPYHLLPMSSQFLTICYMRRIDNQMRKEPFWGCCCLHTLPLPLASHVLTISSPSATCPELTANCEGIRFGVAAFCITYPYQLLNMSLQCPHYLLHVQN